MSGYSGHNTTGKGNEIAAKRARHNSFSSGSNSNAYPLMDVIFNPKKNEAMNEFRTMVKSNKNVANEWQKTHEIASQGMFPLAKPTFASKNYSQATFKHNANRQKFEGKSTNKNNKKKRRKTMKKRLVRINNNNKNKTKKNNKNSNKKRVTNKMNKTKMGGGRRRKTRRKRRKRRGGTNPGSNSNNSRANGNRNAVRANTGRPNNQVLVSPRLQRQHRWRSENLNFTGNLIGSNGNFSNSNNNSVIVSRPNN